MRCKWSQSECVSKRVFVSWNIDTRLTEFWMWCFSGVWDASGSLFSSLSFLHRFTPVESWRTPWTRSEKFSQMTNTTGNSEWLRWVMSLWNTWFWLVDFCILTGLVGFVLFSVFNVTWLTVIQYFRIMSCVTFDPCAVDEYYLIVFSWRRFGRCCWPVRLIMRGFLIS